MKNRARTLIGFAGIVTLFVLVSSLVQDNEELLRSLIYRHEMLGIFIYVALAVFTTVVAPLSSVPFIPFMSLLYGGFVTAILSILGWWIGAWIAFWLARRYGRKVVAWFVSLDTLKEFEERIPKENLFWYVVFLRILIPVDVLSYALGLLSAMPMRTYLLATLVGITPFAFVFSFAGMLSFFSQITLFFIIFIGFLVAMRLDKKRRKMPTKY